VLERAAGRMRKMELARYVVSDVRARYSPSRMLGVVNARQATKAGDKRRRGNKTALSPRAAQNSKSDEIRAHWVHDIAKMAGTTARAQREGQPAQRAWR